MQHAAQGPPRSEYPCIYPRNQRISRQWRCGAAYRRFRLQSSPLIKPNLSALFQWRTSRAAACCAPASRFIFVGNQPKIVNGEAMELPASGSWIMDSEAAKSSGDVAMENAGSGLQEDSIHPLCSHQWSWLLPFVNPYSMSDFNALPIIQEIIGLWLT